MLEITKRNYICCGYNLVTSLKDSWETFTDGPEHKCSTACVINFSMLIPIYN